jgi:hypothetical protein
MDYDHAMRLARGNKLAEVRDQLRMYIDKFKGANFSTPNPHVDIRHDRNMTKNRRGVHRRYKLPYWGTMEDILGR